MQDYKKLKVWEKGHGITLDLYRLTASFPKEELYGLASQLRRSCASIPANISEGCGRGSNMDFGRFLQIALGSAFETEYHLLLAHDLGYIELVEYQKLSSEILEIKQMLSGLLKKLKTDN